MSETKSGNNPGLKQNLTLFCLFQLIFVSKDQLQ